MNNKLVALCIGAALLGTGAGSSIGLYAQELPQNGLYADYQESGLQATGNSVTGWNSSPLGAGVDTIPRALNRIVETPRLMRVQTPNGPKKVLALDGQSSVWGTVQAWGSIPGDRTLLVLARLAPNAHGTLFDGSTLAGLSRAQVKDGSWLVGSNDSLAPTLEAKSATWQLHAFVFHPQGATMTISHSLNGQLKNLDAQKNVPQGGLILGTDASRANGLEAQIGEVLVYNRALNGGEVQQVKADLEKRWGRLDALGAPESLGLDGAANTSTGDLALIASKLADSKTPLIWLWCGDSTGEQGIGQARSEAQNFAERVRWEKNRRRDMVIDQTAPGLDAATINADFETRIGRFKPSVVVLSPTGDEAALTRTLELVRNAGAIPVLQSNGPNATLVQKVAQAQNVLLVPNPGQATAASLSLALFEVLGLKDASSATVKQLAG